MEAMTVVLGVRDPLIHWLTAAWVVFKAAASSTRVMPSTASRRATAVVGDASTEKV